MRTSLLMLLVAAGPLACNDSAGPLLLPPPPVWSIQLAPNGSGNHQSDTVDATLLNPLRVLVRRHGIPAEGVTVSWSVHWGAISPGRTTTDASGIAQATWTLGDTAGVQYATAVLLDPSVSDPDSAPLQVSFTATARPGAPATLSFWTGPANVLVGRPFLPAIAVAELDRHGFLSTEYARPVTIALDPTPSCGPLSGTTTAHPVGGVATFAYLRLDRAGTGCILTATADGLMGISSATFEVVSLGPGSIAFGSPRGIEVMDLDGSGRAVLIGGAVAQPAWSSDGARLAYVRTFDQWQTSAIYTVQADGSDERRITDGTQRDGGPAWSPDGTKIAFHRGSQLVVVNADGSAPADLPWTGTLPEWSPDGTRLAFVLRVLVRCPPIGKACPRPRVAVGSADGTGTASVIGSLGSSAPDWSPDGAQLAFTYLSDVWLTNTNGASSTINLTMSPVPGLQESNPAWSPDGAWIAFAGGFQGSQPDLYVMRPDGTGLVQVTATDESESDPAWRPVPPEPAAHSRRVP